MKKRGIKSLQLHKRSISNLTSQSVKGGTITTITYHSCWSCISCPTIDCTEGELCNDVEETIKKMEEAVNTILDA
jgi:hypothetical protein